MPTLQGTRAPTEQSPATCALMPPAGSQPSMRRDVPLTSPTGLFLKVSSGPVPWPRLVQGVGMHRGVLGGGAEPSFVHDQRTATHHALDQLAGKVLRVAV